MESISLIHGDQVVDDFEFCRRHNDVTSRYALGIMTLQVSPKAILEEVADIIIKHLLFRLSPARFTASKVASLTIFL